ncbi:MAG: DNA-processing protein DprA [Rhodovarius sp.]|nr:DNA-processing protein DprA [Rhodovarius sp.]MDW8313829.1 DNA-processing protein DprA [Rhodovarius sp.]
MTRPGALLGRFEGEAARLALARCEGIGPRQFRRLLDRHRTAEAALAALASKAPERLPDPGAIAAECEAMAELGARFLFLGEAGYPPLLAELSDPPPVLAVLGDPAALAPRAVAIVGARNASALGQRFAERLAADLARAGLAVVSGLARGIDAAAHSGALAGRGRTIAAIAGGLDVAYPAENAALQERIVAEGGLLVTEAPLGTRPQARHFPRRNRLIAGLALGVVVVEAMDKSGTLITARLALDQGRELFAVPGHPFEPRARGPNELLRQGAHICEGVEDVLAHLPEAPADTPLLAPAPPPRRRPAPPAPPATPTLPEAAALLDLLGPTPVSVDDLARCCQLSPDLLRPLLLELELEGRVHTLPGDRVVRA